MTERATQAGRPGLLARVATAVDSYVMTPMPAARLGVLRILVGGFALVYLFARLPYLLSYAYFVPEQFRPIGVVAVTDRPLLPAVVIALTLVTAALSIPFVLGWRYRVVGPLFAALCLWTLTYRNAWGMVFHTENLLVMHVIVLGLSRSADAWSLDARAAARAGRAEPAPHGRYGWPVRLMTWIIVIAYILAGVAKLKNSGTGWIWGDELRNYIAIDNARKVLLGDIYSPLAAPLLHVDYLFRVLAALTLVIELAAPVALLSVRAALVWVLLALGFHWGVLVLMMIVFPYQMTGVGFACFFPVERGADWLRARYEKRRRDRLEKLEKKRK